MGFAAVVEGSRFRMDRRRRDEAQLVARILCHFFARALARNCHLDRGPRLWRRSSPRADRAANFGAGGRAGGRGDSSRGAGERVGKNDRRARDDHRAGRVALWRVHGFRGAQVCAQHDLGRRGQAGPRVFHARARPFSFVLDRARDWLSAPCLARAQCGARRTRQIHERPAAAPRRRLAGVRFSRLVCGHQRALRDDFQNAAKRAHRLARRADRRGGHGAAFHHRQVPHRPLSRHQQHRFELRRSRLGGDRARMDLLLVMHPVFRRGVHESLRSQIRLRHRAEQSCGARERFAASKTLFGANAAITKATR